MSKDQNEFKPKFKLYHSFILSCLLTTLLIINSNHMKKIRTQNKLNQEKNKFFNNIIFKRYLEGEGDGEENKNSGTKEVCERGSEELNKYYETGNLNDIELKEGAIECKDKDEDYIQALINILKSYGGGGLEMRNLQEAEEDNSEEENGDLKENLITYGKHVIPILIFMVVAILCIPGWLICCFCCCCNCCCCCCCKKPGCKIPCFIISYAMYALVVAVCFYGFSQSNHIFTGLADTECSILKFFDEVIDGESKNEPPRWAGIEGIKRILQGIKSDINSMGEDTKDDLNNKMDAIEREDPDTHTKSGKKKDFLDALESFGNQFYSGGNYLPGYYHDYTSENNGIATTGKYVFDLVKKLGTYDTEHEKGIPDNSFIYAWVEEYKAVASIADDTMDQARSGFNDILGTKMGQVNDALDNGINKVDEIYSSFADIKGGVSDILVEYSGIIDEYGKLGVKAVFGVLALIDIGIAVFIFLLCFCSGKACINCCCCRCLCKMCTHILWNVLALLMIIVFLFGSIIALVGKIGGDSMSVFSYLVSEDNLGEDKETILVGGAKDYLTTCINGNGNMENQFEFGESIGSFNNIGDAQNKIIYAKNEFQSKMTRVTYSKIEEELNNRANFNTDLLSLIRDNDDEDILNFGVLLRGINNDANSQEKKEKWDTSCITSDYQCLPNGASDLITAHDSEPETICLHPSKCMPINRDWIETIVNLATPSDSEKSFIDKVKIIDHMSEIVKTASSSTDGSFRKILEGVGNSYTLFLQSYITALGAFEQAIGRITRQLNEYTGRDGGIFSFINCKFIGTNMKIILKYLKESLGNDFYTVGVCLILVGCSLILAISSTILLIIIINVDIEKKKELEKNKGYEINNEGRVIGYRN